MDRTRSAGAFRAIAGDASEPQPKADIDYVVPIFYHIIGDDNGNGYFSPDDSELHCELNEDFETLGIQFYVFDTNYTASNNFYYYEQSNAGSTMFNTLNASNVVNVYITEEAKSGGSVVCNNTVVGLAEAELLSIKTVVGQGVPH